MIKPVRILASIALTVSLTNFSYSQNRVDTNLDSWVGKYKYEEKPVKALAGYYMAMVWDLIITKVDNHYQALLNINGQQTFIEYLTDIQGNSKSIDINFNKQTDGPVYPDNTPFKRERLFTLVRNNRRLTTKWGKLTPRLPEKPPASCSCFLSVK